ncbi:MAG TPA: hypothetical protein VGE84_07845, partial [Allosphingosinicella sp.]
MGRSRTGARSLATASALALVLLVAGCGFQSDTTAESSQTSSTGKAVRKSDPKASDPDMVGAFSGNRGQTGPGLVDLKFKLTK